MLGTSMNKYAVNTCYLFYSNFQAGELCRNLPLRNTGLHFVILTLILNLLKAELALISSLIKCERVSCLLTRTEVKMYMSIKESLNLMHLSYDTPQ